MDCVRWASGVNGSRLQRGGTVLYSTSSPRGLTSLERVGSARQCSRIPIRSFEPGARMSDPSIAIKFVLLVGAIFVGGVAVVSAGVNFEERGMIVSGVAVIIGAVVVAAIGVRGLLGVGNAPGAARGSVRGKMRHFWMPLKEGAGPATEE